MKYLLIVVIPLLFFSACSRSNRAIKERIENADSAAINYFKGDGTMDTVVDVVIIRDKAVLSDLTSFIAESSSPKTTTCGIDGSLHFFKKSMVVQDIDFALDDKKGCMQFSFKLLMGGEWTVTKLSPAAKTLLLSLKKK